MTRPEVQACGRAAPAHGPGQGRPLPEAEGGAVAVRCEGGTSFTQPRGPHGERGPPLPHAVRRRIGVGHREVRRPAGGEPAAVAVPHSRDGLSASRRDGEVAPEGAVTEFPPHHLGVEGPGRMRIGRHQAHPAGRAGHRCRHSEGRHRRLLAWSWKPASSGPDCDPSSARRRRRARTEHVHASTAGRPEASGRCALTADSPLQLWARPPRHRTRTTSRTPHIPHTGRGAVPHGPGRSPGAASPTGARPAGRGGFRSAGPIDGRDAVRAAGQRLMSLTRAAPLRRLGGPGRTGRTVCRPACVCVRRG